MIAARMRAGAAHIERLLYPADIQAVELAQLDELIVAETAVRVLSAATASGARPVATAWATRTARTVARPPSGDIFIFKRR